MPDTSSATMSPQQTAPKLPPIRPRQPRRRSRLWVGLLVLVGVGVLVASILGASNGFGPKTSEANKPAPSDSKDDEIVGFGHVEPPVKLVNLFPKRPGTVTEVKVEVNDFVKEGQLLLTLDATEARNQLAQAQEALNTAQIMLTQAERGPEKKKKLIEEKKALIRAAEKKAGAAKVWFERQEKLRNIGQGTEEVLEKARLDYQAAQEEIEAHRRALEAAELVEPQDEINLAKSKVELNKIQVKQAKDHVEKHVLKAPEDGYILRVLTVKGDAFGPQREEPAFIFRSAEAKIVRAEIEQEFGANVKKGMQVLLIDDTNENRTWEGVVQSVSDWYGPRRRRRFEPRQFNDVLTMECIIKLKKPDADLKIGQRMIVILRPDGKLPVKKKKDDNPK